MTKADVLSIHKDHFYGELKSGDLAALERLYSDRYMLVRPDGSVLNRQEVLQDLREGGLSFQSIELEQEMVRLCGSVAIVTGNSTTVSSRGGREFRSRFRLVAVYAEEDTAIRLVHFQSTNSGQPDRPA